MNCSDIRKRIQERLQQGNEPGADAAVARHVKSCELCRDYYSDAVLARALKEVPVPVPRPGFAAAAIHKAVRNQRVRRMRAFSRIAAAAVIVLVAGLALYTKIPESERHAGVTPEPETFVSARLGEEKTIRVMIEAAEARPDASLFIDLADNISLKNRSSQRQLAWRLDIPKGRNLLELPLILTDGKDGDVNIRYRYNGKEQEVTIRVRPETEHGHIQTTIG